MDYKEELLPEDPRFAQCYKEMLLIIAYGIVHFLLVGVSQLWMGYKKPVEEVQLIAGFPDWFFWGGILGTLIIAIIPFFLITFYFKDMSLNGYEEGDTK